MSHTKPSAQYLDKLRERYAQATQTERSHILDEFVATTGYHRKHAIALLRGHRRHCDPTKPIRRPHARFYTDEDQQAVLWLAKLFDQINSNIDYAEWIPHTPRCSILHNLPLRGLWRILSA